MNTSSLYMDNIFPKLATNFAQIIGDYYEKTTIHFFLSLFVAVEGYAQKTLTLKDCLEIGIENNLSLESKRKEMQKSKYGVSENRARLLLKSTGLPITMTT